MALKELRKMFFLFFLDQLPDIFLTDRPFVLDGFHSPEGDETHSVDEGLCGINPGPKVFMKISCWKPT